MKEVAFKPRAIRTTTPVKAGLLLHEPPSHRNFADINEFKRIDVPAELFPAQSLPKEQSKLYLPPLLPAQGEKISFTGTFNPHAMDRNCGLVRQKLTGNKLELPNGLQTGFFRLEDAFQSRGLQGKEQEAETLNKRKFPREVFASNVKRRFFV